MIVLHCDYCGVEFLRLKSVCEVRKRRGYVRKFCSSDHYHKAGWRNDSRKKAGETHSQNRRINPWRY